jgi:multidrug efflux pump subunit AcrA (membrane-fusion protein)
MNLFILMGLTFAFFTIGCGYDGNQEKWIPVKAEITSRSLTERGILEARELSRIQNKVTGNISELVDDGSRVSTGDVLVKLDDEELRTKLDEQILNLEQFKEDLETEWAEYAVLTNSFSLTSQLKVAERDHARLNLETKIISLPPEDRRLKEIDTELAELDLQDKTDQYLREAELVSKGFAAESSLETSLREKEAAEIFVEEKKSQLELAALPLPEEERLTLETALANAEEAVRRNDEKQKRDLHIQDLTIEGIKLKIEHTSEEITKIQQQVDQVVLRAPNNGIMRLNQKWSWSIRGYLPLSAGQKVNGLDMVGTIVDPNDLSLRIIVHESDYPLIKVGQSVTARLTGFPDQKITGYVRSLTELGQDRNDLSPVYRQVPAIGQAMFLVYITLNELTEKAIPGMTATAEIELESERERLLIPYDAVRREESIYQVTVRRNGQTIEDMSIQGMLTPEGAFEVTRGLQKGDDVLRKGERS